MATTPPPLPSKVGTNEDLGGGHSLYIRWDLAPLPPPPPLVNLPIIIVKGMVLQIEKYLKREVLQIFAAPRLIVQTMPIQSAVVSGRGNIIISRWRPN